MARVCDIRIGTRIREDMGRAGNESELHNSMKVCLAAELSRAGFMPSVEYRVTLPSGRSRIFDVAVPDHRIAFEVYLGQRLRFRTGKEKSRLKELRALGWTVLPVPDQSSIHDVVSSTQSIIIDRINRKRATS